MPQRKQPVMRAATQADRDRDAQLYGPRWESMGPETWDNPKTRGRSMKDLPMNQYEKLHSDIVNFLGDPSNLDIGAAHAASAPILRKLTSNELMDHSIMPEGNAGPIRLREILKEISGANNINLGTKNFYNQKYPYTADVLVDLGDQDRVLDQVKGLNSGHAAARAFNNWPTAESVKILGGPLKSPVIDPWKDTELTWAEKLMSMFPSLFSK